MCEFMHGGSRWVSGKFQNSERNWNWRKPLVLDAGNDLEELEELNLLPLGNVPPVFGVVCGHLSVLLCGLKGMACLLRSLCIVGNLPNPDHF